jgi:hypothetical protein
MNNAALCDATPCSLVECTDLVSSVEGNTELLIYVSGDTQDYTASQWYLLHIMTSERHFAICDPPVNFLPNV